MRVTPIRPIAPTARTLARRLPTLPQRNLNNARRAPTDPNPDLRCRNGRADRLGVHIDLEV
jgi:hypothetical protein